MILVDTGPLVAAANSTDRRHAESVLALSQIRGPRLVPGPVIAETCHLLAREAGAKVEASFLVSFQSGYLQTIDLTAVDLGRAADLVEQYADFPLGGTDACIIALAERLDIDQIVTLDVRHFSVVRAAHGRPFVLLPQARHSRRVVPVLRQPSAV